MEELKKTAIESEKKGYEFVWNLYKKFNERIDKVLSEILDEKEEQKFGLVDLYKWLKNKFKRANEKIKITDEKLFNEIKKESKNEKDNNTASNN